MKKNISLTIDEELLSKAKVLAAKERRSLSQKIELIIAEYIEAQEKNDNANVL
ncbi:MAG: hypothetical protein LH613_11125 [Chamaesiphon sp.]|nr:hypothetical protein [Chamaesiphon sp.]